MPIERFTNDFDDESILISPGTDLSEVPDPFAELLTDEHRAAFTTPSRYFAGLAAECTIPLMRTWLELLADADQCQIEINLCEWSKAVIARVARFQISLREPVDLPPPGLSLKQLYSLILATYHEGFAHAGGLHEPRTVDQYGLHIESDNDVPPDAVAFFTTAGGDSIIAVGTSAYWYSHETCGLVPASTVSDVLAEYFEHLLRGKEREFDFPY